MSFRFPRFGREVKFKGDLMYFKDIEFYKIKFEGEQLKGATFRLTAKEIWNGKIKKESIVVSCTFWNVSQTVVFTFCSIEMDKTFYLFAYILPYEKDGAKYWCAVEGNKTTLA